MLRLIGTILVAAGASWAGFHTAAQLGARTLALEQMQQGIGALSRELAMDAPSLPRLMQRLTKTTQGCAKQLFENSANALKHLEQERFSSAWREAVLRCTALGTQGQQVLLPLGETLGRCTVAQQCALADAIERQLQELCSQAHTAQRSQAKVYRVLGCCAGAVLVIMLI